LKVGGSWKKSGPSFSPSTRAVSQKTRSGSSTSRSRRMCVMRCGAFSVNTNPGGVAAAHPASIAAVGIR
jgi:hypothetical protein